MAVQKVKNIRVFINGKWETLIGQKVLKDNKWLTFTKNCGINKDGIWYVLNKGSV